jgi:hypothetical protein
LNDPNAHLLGSKRIVRIAASRPRLKCKRFFSQWWAFFSAAFARAVFPA